MVNHAKSNLFAFVVVVGLTGGAAACSSSSPIAPSRLAAAEAAPLEEALSINIKGMSSFDSSFAMTPGQQVSAAVYVVSSDGSRSDVSAEVQWASDNSGVAAVERGVLVARGPGSATLSASYRSMATTSG